MLKSSFFRCILAVSALLPVQSFADQYSQYLTELQETLQVEATLISNPNVNAFEIYGKGFKNTIKKAAIPGAEAQQFKIRKVNAKEPWRAGSKSVLTGNVKDGDLVLVAAWLRTSNVKGGGEGFVSNLSLQLSVDPYTNFFASNMYVKNKWQPYYIWGHVEGDFGPKQLSVSVPLLGKKQMLQIGPIYVLNLEDKITEDELAKRLY